MAKKREARHDEASVATFNDHAIITPKRTLKSFARKTAGPDDPLAFDEEAIARAEAALADLSSEFDGWMEAEVTRLAEARDRAAEEGLTAATRAAIYAAAHDLRGEADTFGYPLAARIASSLCNLMDGIAETSELPWGLMVQHVDAIRALLREQAKGEANPVAVALADELTAVTAGMLMELTGAPPLAPEA